MHTLARDTGIAVLIALHDLNHAMRYCDHVLVVANGRLVVSGATLDVITPALLRDVYRVEARIENCTQEDRWSWWTRRWPEGSIHRRPVKRIDAARVRELHHTADSGSCLLARQRTNELPMLRAVIFDCTEPSHADAHFDLHFVNSIHRHSNASKDVAVARTIP